MGKPGDSGRGKRPSDGEDETAHKRLLDNNLFASLAAEKAAEKAAKAAKANKPATAAGVQKKERMPPFYTKGFPETLCQDLDNSDKQGLKVTLRRCTDGYKITVPSIEHYRAVNDYLTMKKVEFFTHDMAAEKPYKAILRGLDDMDTSKLEAELVEVGFKPAKIFKIKRHNTNKRYRDQLYLIHFPKGTTNLKELQGIRGLFNHIVQWERYKPIYREVTQCTNCLNFGHGAKNCHIASRCSNCGESHPSSECVAEEPKTNCVNCGQEHSSTSRSCPKRADFIKFRKQVNERNRRHRKDKEETDVGLTDRGSYPELTPKGRQQDNNQRKSTAGTSGGNVPPPGWGNVRGNVSGSSSFQQGQQQTTTPPSEGLSLVINQLTSLVTEMQTMIRQMMQFFMRCNIQPKTP